MDRLSGKSEPGPLIEGHIMVKELTEKSNAGRVIWIVLVNETEIGIYDQCHRTRSQVVVRIHDAAGSTELHQCVANRIRWWRERWQMEHSTKMPGQRWIRSGCGVSGLNY